MRGGLAAQDARAERDRRAPAAARGPRRARRRRSRLRGRSAARPGQAPAQAASGGSPPARRRRTACAPSGQSRSSAIELHRRRPARAARCARIARPLRSTIARAPLEVELVGDAAPREHRLMRATPSSLAFSSTRSKRSFLSSAAQSQKSGTGSRSRSRLGGSEHDLALADRDDFAAHSPVTSSHRIDRVALRHAHDLGEIVRLVALDASRSRPRRAAGDEQARRAARRPGGSGGHAQALTAPTGEAVVEPSSTG